MTGIPNELSLEFARNWVHPRVSEKRYKHIQGVVQVAKALANLTNENIFAAELAAWLHDACKEMKDKELLAKAKEYRMQLDPVELENGHLLHGPIAALLVKNELALRDESILAAIREHTLGAINMSVLSTIIFLADCLESSRPKEYTTPIWEALGLKLETLEELLHSKPKLTQSDLNKAILVACDLNLKHLIANARVIHPRTVAVRNYYLEKSS